MQHQNPEQTASTYKHRLLRTFAAMLLTFKLFSIRYKSFVPLLAVVLLFSCSEKTGNKTPSLLNSNNLPAFTASIDPAKRNLLRTAQGAMIDIPAGTFKAAGKQQVTITIKEAYTMQDILLAGLSTESNGKALQTAGMIYFNAATDGKEAAFLKPVSITLPGKSFDSDMKLYKAAINEDSSINWIEPAIMDTAPEARQLIDGEALFKANCANCHRPTADYTGPMLARARSRSPTKEWAYRWINNVNRMIEKDPYARKLLKKYGSKMTQFNLPKQDIKAILDYCDNEANLSPYDLKDEAVGEFYDNCGYDTLYYPAPADSIDVLPLADSLAADTADTSSNYSFEPIIADETLPSVPDPYEEKGYEQVITKKGLYQFDIRANGWYNVDKLLKLDESQKVKLLAQINSPEVKDLEMYLCIPKRMILNLADKRKGDQYIFMYGDAEGYLPLVPGDEAFIFATASKNDKAYYGITKFIVQKDQLIHISIKESSKEQILQSLKNNQLDQINLDIRQNEKIIKKYCPDEVELPAGRNEGA